MATKESQYLHAAPCTFQSGAVESVITEFCRHVNDATARCWYDTKLNTFYLRCSQSIGPQANDLLENIISRHLRTGLAAEGGNEKNFDSDIEDGHVEDATNNPTEPTSSPERISQEQRLTPITLHTVAGAPYPQSEVKFFKLIDLPERILERFLSSGDKAVARTVKTAFTCRLIQRKASHDQPCFNGRVGSPCPPPSTARHKGIFATIGLVEIIGHKAVEADEEDMARMMANTFRFAGDAPNVRQFLDGMGITEPDEPDVSSTPPRDHKKFMKEPTLPPLSALQTDVKYYSDSSSDEGESDRESERVTNKIPLDQLFSSKGKQDKTIGFEDQSSKRDREPSCDMKPTLASLIGNSSSIGRSYSLATMKAHTPIEVSNQNANSKSSSASQSVSNSISTDTRPSDIQQSGSERIQDINFPQSSRFAKVDKFGLRGVAAHQAEWEHQNPQPRQTRSNKSGVSRRRTNRSTNFSNSLNQEESDGFARQSEWGSTKSFEINNSALHNESQGLQGWENNVNRPSSYAQLIDDSATLSPAQMQPPPGYNYQAQLEAGKQQRQLQVAQKYHKSTCGDDEKSEEELIDLSDVNTENVQLVARFPTMSTLSTSYLSLNASSHPATGQSDTGINERLQVITPERDLKKNTMWQKAGKRTKSSRSAANASKAIANLPKPDPLPQPKKKAQVNGAHTNQASASKGKVTDSATPKRGEPVSALASVQPKAPSYESNDDQIAESRSKEDIDIKQLLEEVSKVTDLKNVELEVHFGMILVSDLTKKDILDGVRPVDKAGKRLQALQNTGTDVRTDFFRRLTTSVNDAEFLLSLEANCKVCTQVEYEIYIKTSQGQTRLITFEQNNVNDFKVWETDTTLGTLFIHYPVRVWDARVTVNKPKTDTSIKEVAKSFVDSVQTWEEAPRFRAIVPTHAFTIEKIYLKRRAAKMINGMEMWIAEVQHLSLQPVNHGHLNFEAGPQDDMIHDHRFWYELSLHVADVLSMSADNVHCMIDRLMEQMDGVGYYNDGPWERSEPEASVPAKAEVTFW